MLERFLTSIRCYFLNEIIKDPKTINKDSSIVFFLINLSKQCFRNEYSWSQTKGEIDKINKLYDKMLMKINTGERIFDCEILILSSYKILNEFEVLKDYLINNDNHKTIFKVIKRQILDYEYEKKLKNRISSLTKIKNKISLKVRNQYESNPYPRWDDKRKNIPKNYIDIVRQSILPNHLPDEFFKNKTEIKNILIAGCGTGYHPIELALSDPNIEIDAIDLSLSSLAYGKRKAEEMHVENINWIHADILELDNIKKKYDAIESVGVIHHLENPKDGFDSLTNKLKKHGILKLGLYSRNVREELKIAKEMISTLKDMEDLTKIRNAREIIANSDNIKMQYPMKFSDFFATSEFRDLLMHEQEKDFNLLEVKELINDHYKFLGFVINDRNSGSIRSNYRNNFPDDTTMTNLEYWNDFEASIPNLFNAMYQFYLYKNN